jgi:hypothetical protein
MGRTEVHDHSPEVHGMAMRRVALISTTTEQVNRAPIRGTCKHIVKEKSRTNELAFQITRESQRWLRLGRPQLGDGRRVKAGCAEFVVGRFRDLRRCAERL